MKRIKVFSLITATLIFFANISVSNAQDQKDNSSFPWTIEETIQPQDVAARIMDSTAQDMLILNAGPVNNVKGAVYIGPAGDKDGLKALKKYLKKVPKDKEIVVYCGCCPMPKCPNIRPAFEELKKEGFTNFKIMDIEQSLSENWIAEGYPMDDDQ